MQIIPAVNCHHKDFECVAEKVRIAEKIFADLPADLSAEDLSKAGAFAKEGWIHLDIADGRFTYNKTWNDPAAWASLKTDLKLEVHLMVEDVEEMAHEWLAADAKRLVIHAETVNERVVQKIFQLAKTYGADVMCATNPETHLKSLPRLLPEFTMFQVLSVHPGLPGQRFLPRTLQKIVALRRMYPDAVIEADGGMNEEAARAAKEHGADIVIAASYIFGAKDPKVAYEKLKNI